MDGEEAIYTRRRALKKAEKCTRYTKNRFTVR